MKKIILLCFLLSLIPIQRAEAQSLSPVFRKDYEGAAVPFSGSGLTNRLYNEVIEDFEVEISKDFVLEAMERNNRYPALVPIEDEDVMVGFFSGMDENRDLIYIYQYILPNPSLDFDTFVSLVHLVDPTISEANLREVYAPWVEDSTSTDKIELSGHSFDASHHRHHNHDYIEVSYHFPLSLYNNADTVNLTNSFYDLEGDFPDIFSPDYEGEEVFVDRAYINRILDQLSQTFGFELTEDHLDAWGNTVYYYPSEMAKAGRLNEFYIFSGLTGKRNVLEIRFTNGFDTFDESYNLYYDKMTRSYFHFFGKLLDPTLDEEAIELAYEKFQAGEDVEMGRIHVQSNGYTDNSLSMSLQIPTSQLEDPETYYFDSVPSNQAQDVRIDEDVHHLATVDRLNNPDRIYADYQIDEQVVINQTDQKEIYRQLLDDHQVNMPHYQEEIQVTGEIITDLGSGNWKTLQVGGNDYFASFIIYLEGDDLPVLEGNVTVDGRSLGVIRAGAGSGGRILYLIAESVTQDGEVIYNRGGSDND